MKNRKFISKLFWGIFTLSIIILILFLYDLRMEYLEEEIPLNTFIEKKIGKQSKIPKVSINENTFWVDNETNYSNYEIIIENLTKKDIKNWEIIIEFNQNIEVAEYWNSNIEILDSQIKFKNTDYNSIIFKNEKVSFGGIFKGNEKIEVENYKFVLKEKSSQKENKIENSEVLKKEVEVDKKSPVAIHGKLSINGKNIIDKNGKNFLIQGISTHSIKDYSEYINYDSFKYLKEEFNCNTIRLALYSDPNVGYNKTLYSKVDEGIKYATELGLYVIIDWHVLEDKDPNIYKQNAKEFFIQIANKYKEYDNILYEICNEPNGEVSWADVKNYANEIIPLIRDIDKESIIIVGTPDFCKKIDDAMAEPLEEYDNIIYSLHFYSSTHKQDLRDKLEIVNENNFPVIVSEFGITEASGDGIIDEEEANLWIDLLREKNIGYIAWNLSNKDEASAIIKPDIQVKTGWNDEQLTQSGLWLKNKYNN